MSFAFPTAAPGSEWWRSAVIYQIYPRSFADASGDGVGDLRGIESRLDSLAELGIDAIWLSPFMVSPQKDAGYDVADYRDVDPLFGTLADFDELLASAHEREIRLIVDLVPNHSSDQHVWFQAALAAAPGSPERARYIFRDGKGADGELPPNNWESVFGGPAWTRITNADGTPGQWYLHLFDSSQPDFDWTNEEVRAEFRSVLRFWLDRGADGFRVDVAHGMIKAAGLPDYTPPTDAASMGGAEPVPYWGQDGVHEIYRDWHTVLAEYAGDRVLCAEAWLPTNEETALWVRPDEMHQAFNFNYMYAAWSAAGQRESIETSIAAFNGVGAPSTWVLSNHDVVRHATRLALTIDNPQGEGIGPKTPGPRPDAALGLRRARAATSLMLALPGSSYLYQGEELGLPEVIDLPDEARQDPSFFRTNGERYGRDGCRVPIPWEADAPAFGFNDTGASWLPQPAEFADFSRATETGAADSTLELYKRLLAERAARSLGTETLEWLDRGTDVLAFHTGDVEVVTNFGPAPVSVDASRVILSSEPLTDGALPTDTTVWLTA
ncbi:glycoside hydrolase family 13 protein [Microbacterium gorillae]|uniref:glycoside hydrolase family 13 protein n=1 Tax=Microbacterium gorillae TaxID=1231063 RepID=UPI00058F47DA|nr:glycoside hydrolase family 13 protein [Microbacterium gorillae]